MPHGRGCFGRRWFGWGGGSGGAGSSRRAVGGGGGGGSGGGRGGGRGAAPGGLWPSNLSGPQTVDIYRHGIPVPPSCRLAHGWHVTSTGYATPGPAQPGPWNPEGRLNFWVGRDFDTVVSFYKSRGIRADAPNAPLAPPAAPVVQARAGRRARAGAPAAPAAPAAAPEFHIPPELAAMQEEGDPLESPGLIRAIRNSTSETDWMPPEDVVDPRDPADEPGYWQAIRESTDTLAQQSSTLEEFFGDLGSSDDSDGGEDGGEDGGQTVVVDLVSSEEE